MKLKQSDTIVVLSTADWDTKYLTNKQHTAKELAKIGYKVLYVESVGLRNPKVNSAMDWKRLILRAYAGLKTLFLGSKQVDVNIHVISPLVSPFFKNNFLIRKFNSVLLNFLIERSLKGNDHILWSYHPYVMDIVRKDKHCKLIYHCVDDLSSVPGVNSESFEIQEANFLKLCNYVFVTAPKLKERCIKYNTSVTYLSNVVDYEHFSARSSNNTDNIKKKIVYHGVLSDFKLDLSLFFNIIKNHPQYHFVLVGEEREGQSSELLREIFKLKNVEHVGYVPYSKLPELLAQCDLGILPSQINDYTNSMFPMKFYEFIASGLPIVSTKLNAIEGIESKFIQKISSSSEFSIAAESLLTLGKIPCIDRELLIGKNTWKERTSIMLNIIDESESKSITVN